MTLFKSLVLTFALLIITTPLWAQSIPGTLIQQSPTRLDAAGLVSTSVTSASTITITPPASNSVYVTDVEITNCAGGTAVTAAAPTTITTTNLGGVAWTLGSGVTAGVCQPSPSVGAFPTALKSASPGVAVTVVLPTFATNQTVRVTVYYYFAP